MGYNYGVECYKFYRKWDKLYQEYVAAGMSEVAIRELFDLDWQEFKSERIYRIHNRSLESSFPGSDVALDDNSPLIHSQLEHLSVNQPEIYTWGRFDWIEDIDTPELAIQLKSLSQTDLELLTRLVFEDQSRAEIAQAIGISRSAISQRLARIKNILGKSALTLIIAQAA